MRALRKNREAERSGAQKLPAEIAGLGLRQEEEGRTEKQRDRKEERRVLGKETAKKKLLLTVTERQTTVEIEDRERQDSDTKQTNRAKEEKMARTSIRRK